MTDGGLEPISEHRTLEQRSSQIQLNLNPEKAPERLGPLPLKWCPEMGWPLGHATPVRDTPAWSAPLGWAPNALRAGPAGSLAGYLNWCCDESVPGSTKGSGKAPTSHRDLGLDHWTSVVTILSRPH
jgi:hypothetical protein